MNDLQIFESSEFGSIRTIEINGEPWFVGKDVAEILGYSNPSEAISEHVDNEDKLNSKTLSSFELNLGQRGGWLINESGLYSLILSSKLPNAKQFKHWVTNEVLPSIRKHGLYAVDELLNNPEFAIKAFTALKEEREKRAIAERKIVEQKPLVDFAMHVSQAKDTIDMEEMAKVANDEHINIGRNRLIKWLKEKRVFLKTVVTGKGQIWIVEKLRAEYGGATRKDVSSL